MLSDYLQWEEAYFASGYACEGCDHTIYSCYVENGVNEHGVRDIYTILCHECYEGDEEE